MLGKVVCARLLLVCFFVKVCTRYKDVLGRDMSWDGCCHLDLPSLI